MEELRRWLEEMGDPVVAVRSSASNEDTILTSAAGQHDSFLGVRGLDAVVDAVHACRASLWSARATAYRKTTEVPSMAVIIQLQIDADVSGVMFTPATPDDPTLIESSWGLGPTVVEGRLTPDRYEVLAGTVTSTIADKPTSLTTTGPTPVPTTKRRTPTLTNTTAIELAALGTQAATLFDHPQDLEWALTANTLWLLQSRPITAHPPTPTNPRHSLTHAPTPNPNLANPSPRPLTNTPAPNHADPSLQTRTARPAPPPTAPPLTAPPSLSRTDQPDPSRTASGLRRIDSSGLSRTNPPASTHPDSSTLSPTDASGHNIADVSVANATDASSLRPADSSDPSCTDSPASTLADSSDPGLADGSVDSATDAPGPRPAHSSDPSCTDLAAATLGDASGLGFADASVSSSIDSSGPGLADSSASRFADLSGTALAESLASGLAGPPADSRTGLQASAPTEPQRVVLSGTPASHGDANGPARIVRGPADFSKVQSGDILVCPHTDPAWTPLLTIVAGVVTESGGILSHAAIVAREQSIPAVVAVPQATTRIPDGTPITINGTTGSVRLNRASDT
ncbi:PEP/pyruvate-binding domain-containing protein [Kribbella sp. NPDC004536]|uniref:PEP/pyruvate-binding domain-containing protein n=1 Tax=Kribbella sp. NPDC004536 TaxID=3364106 RepID=UPI0036B1746B